MTKQGMEIDIELQAIALFADGKLIGFQAMLHDVTERKKAEEVHRETEQKLQSLLNNLPDFIINVNRNGTILYINPLRIFLPASIIFFVLSSLLYLYRLIFGGGFLVSTIITFICGFQLLVIGLLSDLIDKRLQQYDKFK